MRVLLSLLGWFFTLLFTGAAVAVIAGFIVFKHYSKDLPDYSQLSNYDPPTTTRLYAADGRLMAEYATEKRVFVPLPAIPKRVINAFIAAEDKNFYQHQGIDFMGIARAIHTNILHYGQGKSLVGGSTITQQVVKNFLLTDEKSIERKMKEAILAMRISQVYTKDKILELYLNEIFLGLRSYGIGAAALNYFNKPLEDLTIEEAALLAAEPKGPSNYDPRHNYNAAKARRDWVIGRMQEDGYITKEEEKAAIAAPIELHTRAPDDIARADFFAEEVRRWLAAQYGENVLYEGGLVVRTTLDPQLQRYADEALRFALMAYDRKRGYRGPVAHLQTLAAFETRLKELNKLHGGQLAEGQQLAVVTALEPTRARIGFTEGKDGTLPFSLMKWGRGTAKKPGDIVDIGDVVIVGPVPEDQKKPLGAEAKIAWDLQQIPQVNGALVALDPHTGRVLALSGGYAYGAGEFNRATQAKRQPGSAFKPFVYMSGLENGFNPASILLDAPLEMSQGQGLPTWKPQNYEGEYLGPATMRTGLEKSRNTMTVQLAQMVGLPHILEIGKRFGIYDDPAPNFSIVLGATETTLLRLANAYAMLVNGGKKVESALIERIDDRHGKIVYRRDNRECPACSAELNPDAPPPLPADTRDQIADPRVAYQMVSMLEGVVQRGTGVRARVLGRPVAGKTGTTNNSMDTWFIGFTPNLVAGVFIGYDKPQTLGKKETGASVALPGFIHFMQAALKGKPAQPFRIPPGIELMRIDQKTGELVTPDSTPTGPVITEAFITGAPIMVPGRPAPELKDQGATSDAPTENGSSSSGGTLPEGAIRVSPAPVEQAPPVIPAAPARAPMTGTGGLY